MARAPIAQEIEADPEADRLEEFPHPRATTALYGHDGPENLLAESVAGGKMHHGWLITGPEGVGKATLAYRLAKHLLADPTERDQTTQTLAVAPTTRAARQVLALSHPGLLVMRRVWRDKRFTATIPVEEVRRLRAFLNHTADTGQWRMVLVDSADDLNPNAANAILKSLEEPPRQTVFVLLTSEPGRLLPTIRSRCRTLDLGPLAPDPLKQAVMAAFANSEATPPGGEDWTRLEELSGGSVRRALTIASSGGLELYQKVSTMVSLLPRVDWGAMHSLGDSIGGAAAEQKFEAYFDFLTGLLARLIRARATGEGRAADLKLAHRLIAADALPHWAEAWDGILRDKAETMLLNLDRKALVLATATRLMALKPAR